MKHLILTVAAALALSLLVASSASAQVVVNPATAGLDFFSADHSAVIPVGQPNAGQPAIVSYQALVFPSAITEPFSGTPTITGVVVPKASVVPDVTPGFLRLTFAQMGITNLPACAVVAPAVCPAFSIVLVGTGPNGPSLKAVISESDSFMRAALIQIAPAGPSQLKVVP
jgi:hypothetical protein